MRNHIITPCNSISSDSCAVPSSDSCAVPWLWPPSQYPTFIQQDHLAKDLPSEDIESLTLLDLHVTHIQNSQEHRLQHVSFSKSILWCHQRNNDYESEIITLTWLLMRNHIITPCNSISSDSCAVPSCLRVLLLRRHALLYMYVNIYPHTCLRISMYMHINLCPHI